MLEAINVEGAGFSGMDDLMTSAFPFGGRHVFEVVVRTGKQGVELAVDGASQGKRDKSPSTIHGDELTIGARFYTNEPKPPSVGSHFAGDLAEVLVFNRALNQTERSQTTAYLKSKYQQLDEALGGGEGALSTAMQPIETPPEVQMLAQGFSAFKLPIDLKNVNNLRYRPDGKLAALLYNGDVYLLSDTDGDGFEDKADLFWKSNGSLRGPIGMALTPPAFKGGWGVFVPSKGKCSLILDENGDDKADKEVVVASGWQEIAQSVDAVGVAVDKDGAVYFGLGTANYANAYLLDDAGKAHYELGSDHGTIQRIGPDLKTRSTVATGVRFTIGLAFNKLGDLFATDQEGATWLPNGNPFDELLHIQEGRHFGFPPAPSHPVERSDRRALGRRLRAPASVDLRARLQRRRERRSAVRPEPLEGRCDRLCLLARQDLPVKAC